MFNNVVLIGRLTKEPEMKYTPDGTPVTKFTLAVDRGFKDKDGKQEADFIPIVVWRKTAESCAEHLNKGRLVAVRGQMRIRNYDKDGERRYVTEVVADNVRFLERKNGSSGETPGSDVGQVFGDDDVPF